MKNNFVLSSLPAFALLANVANGMEFNDKFYGKANAKIGIGFQTYSGFLKDVIQAEEDFGDNGTNKYNWAVNFGVGYDVFYKASDLFHPFVGLEAKGRVPFAGLHFVRDHRFNEFFNLHARFGSKINVNKDFSVLPYYLLGFNVAKYDYINVQEQTDVINENNGHYETIEVPVYEERQVAVTETVNITRQPTYEEASQVIFDQRVENIGQYELDYYGGNFDNWFSFSPTGIVGAGDSGLTNANGAGRSVQFSYHNGYLDRQQAEQYFSDIFGDSYDVQYVKTVTDNNGRELYYYADPSQWVLDETQGTVSQDINTYINNPDNVVTETRQRETGEFTTEIVQIGTTIVTDEDEEIPVVQTIRNKKSKTKVGLSTGVGVDFLLKDRFIVGLEYRYAEVKFSSILDKKVKTHNFGINFGYQFL